MERINVVGTSCSGKTTLARAVAARLGLPYTELDALFWGRDWTPIPDTWWRRSPPARTSRRWLASLR